jgi:hypothetical protein
MKLKSKYSKGEPSTRRRINTYATLQGILSRRRLI